MIAEKEREQQLAMNEYNSVRSELEQRCKQIKRKYASKNQCIDDMCNGMLLCLNKRGSE